MYYHLVSVGEEFPAQVTRVVANGGNIQVSFDIKSYGCGGFTRVTCDYGVITSKNIIIGHIPRTR